MTIKQEEQIAHLRWMGESYGTIAESLGVSVNTVKSFCQRKNLGGKKKAAAQCAYCGKEVGQTEHRKVKKFCSNACRMKWWNEHRHLIDRRAVATFCCQNCGTAFTDYKTAERKYCSHECYIASRFGGSNHECGTVPQRKTVSDHDEPCGVNAETGPCFG